MDDDDRQWHRSQVLKMIPLERERQGEMDATREGCPLLPQDESYMKGWNKTVKEINEADYNPYAGFSDCP